MGHGRRAAAARQRPEQVPPPTDVRRRLTDLKAQIKKLRTHKAQLEFDLEQPPQPLTPGDREKISSHIRDVLAHGSPQARKGLYEALIHEIEVHTDDSVTPIFRLPLAGNDEGLALTGPAHDAELPNHAVRALPTTVGDTGIEPVTPSV